MFLHTPSLPLLKLNSLTTTCVCVHLWGFRSSSLFIIQNSFSPPHSFLGPSKTIIPHPPPSIASSFKRTPSPLFPYLTSYPPSIDFEPYALSKHPPTTCCSVPWKNRQLDPRSLSLFLGGFAKSSTFFPFLFPTYHPVFLSQFALDPGFTCLEQQVFQHSTLSSLNSPRSRRPNI